jgi:hypothetical protein
MTILIKVPKGAEFRFKSIGKSNPMTCKTDGFIKVL